MVNEENREKLETITRNLKGVSMMANVNASYSPVKRSDHIRTQIQKLEKLGHACRDGKAWEQFDYETEELLIRIFGATHSCLESYKYATLGEAEALVNMPEGAQEPPSQDIPQKAFQQRRQLLHGILSDLEKLDKVEEEALTGEDHEDPPSLT